jgi:hypothetical protein
LPCRINRIDLLFWVMPFLYIASKTPAQEAQKPIVKYEGEPSAVRSRAMPEARPFNG